MAKEKKAFSGPKTQRRIWTPTLENLVPKRPDFAGVMLDKILPLKTLRFAAETHFLQHIYIYMYTHIYGVV